MIKNLVKKEKIPMVLYQINDLKILVTNKTWEII